MQRTSKRQEKGREVRIYMYGVFHLVSLLLPREGSSRLYATPPFLSFLGEQKTGRQGNRQYLTHSQVQRRRSVRECVVGNLDYMKAVSYFFLILDVCRNAGKEYLISDSLPSVDH